MKIKYDIRNLKLHEEFDIEDSFMRVFRVFGGWIYYRIDPETNQEIHATFVKECAI